MTPPRELPSATAATTSRRQRARYARRGADELHSLREHFVRALRAVLADDTRKDPRAAPPTARDDNHQAEGEQRC